MKAFKTDLLQIPGIGPHKAKSIVKGGVKTMRMLSSLSVEDLCEIKGVGPVLAEGIHQFFHGPAVEAPAAPAAAVAAPAAVARPSWTAQIRTFVAELATGLKQAFELSVVSMGDACLGTA